KYLQGVMAVEKKRICVFGTYDIIHLGHIHFLNNAKKLGGSNTELTVVIARDSSVLRLKNRNTVFPEEHRRQIVENLKAVDKAVLGNEGEDKFSIIEKIRPDMIVLGYDQWITAEELKKKLEKRFDWSIDINTLPKYEIDGLNSSSTVQKRISQLRTS
ncbi:MAG: adenylyltransferase/cytidyltransferase family protein, partial [Candidatus Hodarchaeota archaeon]